MTLSLGDLKNSTLKPEYSKILKSIEESLVGEVNTGPVKKTGFSASALFYGPGKCPRRWSLVFRGVDEQDDPWAYYNRRAVRSGSAAHEHLQELFLAHNPNLKTEVEFWEKNPRMHGFIDLFYEDENVPGEIKTVGNRAFEVRKNTKEPTDYHEKQLLVYMHVKKSDFGFLVYENRDTFEILIIPVKMTAARRAEIERIFAWMREIEKAHDEGKLVKVYPKRRANSAMCNKCPIRKACDEAGEGEVSIELQDKFEV